MVVRNDTPQTVELFNCGNDPATIMQGQWASVDEKSNDSSSACDVRDYSGQTYVGCLLMPTTRYKSGEVFYVSQATKKVPEADCGN